MKAGKGYERLMARLQQQAKAVDEAPAPEGATTPAPVSLFLPGLDEFMRTMPNHIARSSLFAPVAPGRKKMHDGTVLVSRGDAVIRFKGKQLDEAQADVWMQAMHEAIKHTLGTPIVINRAAFLKAIGRNTSGENYRWLHRAMEDLSFAMLVLEVRKPDGSTKMSIGKARALHLIQGFDFDEAADTYTLSIDPRWRAMYGNSEFARIDWEKRLQFGQHQNMAKALQRLVATSDDVVQRYALDWLKAKLEYSGRERDFRDALERAMRELERLEIIAKGRIEDSTKGAPQAVWTRL